MYMVSEVLRKGKKERKKRKGGNEVKGRKGKKRCVKTLRAADARRQRRGGRGWWWKRDRLNRFSTK